MQLLLSSMILCAGMYSISAVDPCTADDLISVGAQALACTGVSGVQFNGAGKLDPVKISPMCKYPECLDFFNALVKLNCTTGGVLVGAVANVCNKGNSSVPSTTDPTSNAIGGGSIAATTTKAPSSSVNDIASYWLPCLVILAVAFVV